VSAAWLVWAATGTLETVEVGAASPVGVLISFSPLVVGTIGFWFMRLWAVVLLAVTSVVSALLVPAEIVWGGLIVAICVGVPPAIIAFLHRARFRWW
jgi:hypothetical protein